MTTENIEEGTSGGSALTDGLGVFESNGEQLAKKNTIDAAVPPAPTFPPVLDACCGPKGMWFDKNNPLALYMDKRRETHVDTYPCGTKTNVIDPCVIGDFSKMNFPDESFRLVVFDPPHIEQTGESQITKKYGSLQGDWREMLRAGFAECFRVLKPEGVLIFKWNDCRFPVKDILQLATVKPLFGHKSGKKMGTHWVTFMKPPNAELTGRSGDSRVGPR